MKKFASQIEQFLDFRRHTSIESSVSERLRFRETAATGWMLVGFWVEASWTDGSGTEGGRLGSCADSLDGILASVLFVAATAAGDVADGDTIRADEGDFGSSAEGA